jgi:tol-pal system protein YbgF
MAQIKNAAVYTILTFVFSVIMLLVSGCAPQEQLNSLDRRVNGLSVENGTQAREIAALKNEIKTLRQQGAGGDDHAMEVLRSAQADNAGRLEHIQAELMRLNGQVEQLAQSHVEQKAAFAKLREETLRDIEKLRTEVRLLQKSTGITRKVEDVRRQAAGGEVDLYQEALDLIKAGKYPDAKKTLKKYIDTSPGGNRIANAHFWMGECEYNMQRYEEAILEYQKVISRFPKSNKVPDALYKQGLAFVKLGDSESARIVLSRLVKKFPSSPQASVAKKQLKHLR